MLLVHLRRVSTGEQVSGTGLDRQTQAAAAYAEARGWKLHPEVYSDEGVSGFSGANLEGDLGRFLRDLKAGRLGPDPIALGIEDLDRLSRQFSLAFLPVLVDDLLNAGVTLSVLTKGRDISRESIRRNAMELHELLFWMGAAHDFSDKLSNRIGKHRESIRKAIREGRPANPGAAPSWISLDEGEWQLNEYANTIRRVISMAQGGDGAMAIARALNAEGEPSPGWMKAKRQNRKLPKAEWDKNSVLQVLKSPALHGARAIAKPGHNAAVRRWKESCAHLARQGVKAGDLPAKPKRELEQEQENYYPALISQAEHQLLLQTLSKRRTNEAEGRRDRFNWIGQRLTRCTCGAAMTTTTSSSTRGGKRVTYQHLRCTGKRDGSTACKARLVKIGDAQSHLLARLSYADFNTMLGQDIKQGRISDLTETTTRRNELQKQTELLAQRQAAGEKALADADDPGVLAVMAKRQAALEQELTATHQALAAADMQLQQLAQQPPIHIAMTEAQGAIRGLIRTFLEGSDTPADRRLVNEHCRRISLQIVIDSQQAGSTQVGLAIAGGPVQWQPLAAELARQTLEKGGHSMSAFMTPSGRFGFARAKVHRPEGPPDQSVTTSR